MQVQSLGREDLLEEEMASRSSILAWEAPEEPGRPQSIGSHRVGHNRSDLAREKSLELPKEPHPTPNPASHKQAVIDSGHHFFKRFITSMMNYF